MQADIDLGPHPAEQVWVNSIISVSSAVILYYDYLLTLEREIRFLWPPHNKQGWFTTACLLNRYIPVIGHIPILVSYFITLDFPRTGSVRVLTTKCLSDRSCEGLHDYHEWLVMAVQGHAGLLCIIRVYALYGRSPRVLGLLTCVGLAAFVTASVRLFTQPSKKAYIYPASFLKWAILESRHEGGQVIPVLSTFVGCSQYTKPIGGRFAAIAWTGLLVFDSIIFSLTLYRAFKIGRGIRLLDVIVRDGTIYFSALFVMNLANIFSLRFSPPLLKTSTTTLTNVLSTTLVSRLVLNLREQSSVLVCLPTSVETERRFQARLPVAQQSMTSLGPMSFRPNKSMYGASTSDITAMAR
ncbi:hypothetical protein F5148DRAFT_1294683 [Russula earlei]|uniref:Uncharacterized protein n=1 Tax=Russula earlei TaxID=71964 RepID=A0ACC0TRI5_9AGAM|nr:hypothetical protein F5148DRAFT_1294683 [Russula earlei]